MRKHKWSEQDYALLERNVNKLGISKGCKKTAEQLYVSTGAARSMYWVKFQKFKNSGIKIDHPEIAKNAKVVEEKKTRKCVRWTDIEIELLKNNMLKYGFTKGADRTAASIERTHHSCRLKAYELVNKGFDHKHKKRVNLSKKEDELVRFFEEKIGENPNNLQAVFREGAEIFGVSPQALSNRWYGYDNRNVGMNLSSKPTCRKNMKTIYTVIGKNATINGKNQNEPDVTETKNIFEKVVDWFKNKFNK